MQWPTHPKLSFASVSVRMHCRRGSGGPLPRLVVECHASSGMSTMSATTQTICPRSLIRSRSAPSITTRNGLSSVMCCEASTQRQLFCSLIRSLRIERVACGCLICAIRFCALHGCRFCALHGGCWIHHRHDRLRASPFLSQHVGAIKRQQALGHSK